MPTATRLTPTPTQTPVLPSIAETMVPVAAGQGVPEAAVYNPGKPGPHRVVLLTETGSSHEWNKTLPADWLPSSVNQTELVILVGPEKEIDLGSAIYYYPGDPKQYSVSRYRFEMDVEIREARTGETLEIATIRGSEPKDFPPQLPAGTTRINGGRVADSLLIGWMMCNVIMSGVCEMRILGNTNPSSIMAFSPDGQTLVTGGGNGAVIQYLSDGSAYSLTLGEPGFQGLVYSVAYSPDGQTVALGRSDNTVVTQNVSNSSLLWKLSGHTDIVRSVAFSPDGLTLASGSDDGTVRLWRVLDGILLNTLEVGPDVYSVAFSADGLTLASGSRDRFVRLWRVSDGTLLNKLEAGSRTYEVAFSSDGQFLAAASDSKIWLWRVSDDTEVRILEGHTGDVISVDFSPDGQSLVSGSYDKTVRIWRIEDGTLLLTLWGHTESVECVLFSPDGQTIASGSLDGIRLWLIR